MRDFKKCKKLFHWISVHGGNKGISILQETYSTVEIEKEWKEHFDGEIVCSHGSPKSKGVAILQLSNSLDCRITNQWTDNDGRMIILQFKHHSRKRMPSN